MEKKFIVRAGETLFLKRDGKVTRMWQRAERFATVSAAYKFMNAQKFNEDLTIDTLDEVR